MNNGELNLLIIGLICLAGFAVVAVETRAHRRRLRKGSGALQPSEADRKHAVTR
jgi:hypothetical protein